MQVILKAKFRSLNALPIIFIEISIKLNSRLDIVNDESISLGKFFHILITFFKYFSAFLVLVSDLKAQFKMYYKMGSCSLLPSLSPIFTIEIKALSNISTSLLSSPHPKTFIIFVELSGSWLISSSSSSTFYLTEMKKF